LYGIPDFALEGAGDGYHLYQLRYDPVSASADLFVDGVERLSNYFGVPGINVPRVGWGAGGGPGTGQGNFAAVRFAVVPEPGTAAITCVLLAVGALVRRKLGIFKT
jgi:hypothetical protein